MTICQAQVITDDASPDRMPLRSSTYIYIYHCHCFWTSKETMPTTFFSVFTYGDRPVICRRTVRNRSSHALKNAQTISITLSMVVDVEHCDTMYSDEQDVGV